MAALKKMAAPQVKAAPRRHIVTIPSQNVVPGDIIQIDAGDAIRRTRLLESPNLRIRRRC